MNTICENTSLNPGRLPRQTRFPCLLLGKDKYTLVDVCGSLCEQLQPWGCVFGTAHPRTHHPAAGTSWKTQKQLWVEASSWRRASSSARPMGCPSHHTPACLACVHHSECLPQGPGSPQTGLLAAKPLWSGSFQQPQKGRFVVLTKWTFMSQSTHGPGRMLPIHTPAPCWVRVSGHSREALGLAPEPCSDHRLQGLDRLCTCAQLRCLV